MKNRHSIIGKIVLASMGVAPAVFASAPAGILPQSISPLTNGDLCRAHSMIDEKNYTGALDQLRDIDLANLDVESRQEVTFLIARTAYMRGDDICVTLLDNYAADYPASEQALTARLLAADYFFFNHDFPAALARYNEISSSAIEPAQQHEYTFRRALAMLKCGYPDQAAPLFRSLIADGDFAIPAEYYLAYIDYLNKDYDKAYKAFASLPEISSSTRSSRGQKRDYISDGIEPGYYMTQIEFLNQDYTSAIRHGRSLLEKRPVDELLPETLRVLGESYFRTASPEVARHYLERYIESTDSPAPSALYSLGSLLYDDGRYDEAAALFAKVAGDDSSLSQSAWLYLGQCAIQENDNSAAAIAFEKAARSGYDSNISETALYNYATALLRGGNIPFSSSARLLEEFLTKYPDSAHASDVRATLAEAYCRQGDFGKALSYLDGIHNPSSSVRLLRQQVLFQYGVELQSNGESAPAEKYLREAADSPADKDLALQARLWLGDALYSQKKYAAASEALQAYVSGARSSAPDYGLGLYNLAYSLYQQDKFQKAASYFRQAAGASSLQQAQRANARLRLADCIFYSRDFKGAKEAYEKVIEAADPGADYATLRHATIRGLLGDVPGKIKELDMLSSKYPGTSWNAAALLEKAATLIDEGKISDAQDAYKHLAREYPDRPETRKGLLGLAQSFRAQGKTTQAIDSYSNIITRWPSSEEALLAHEDLSSIHAAEGSLQQYAAWLNGIQGAPRISGDEMERLEYRAAADAFAADVNNLALLEDYVKRYPEGENIAAALYDLADGRLEAHNYKGALQAVDLLLMRRPDSPQADAALLIRGEILENHSDSADARAKAFDAYSRLESKGNPAYSTDALCGMMRTAPSAEKQVTLADKVLRAGGSSDQMEEASFYKAEGLLKEGRDKEALSILTTLSGHPAGIYGAKAAVALGQYRFDHKDYAAAEKVLSEFADSGTPHEYWLARGFILLADVYSARGKKYLAKEYLESLKTNYPGDEADIREMITRRLSKL